MRWRDPPSTSAAPPRGHAAMPCMRMANHRSAAGASPVHLAQATCGHMKGTERKGRPFVARPCTWPAAPACSAVACLRMRWARDARSLQSQGSAQPPERLMLTGCCRRIERRVHAHGQRTSVPEVPAQAEKAADEDLRAWSSARGPRSRSHCRCARKRNSALALLDLAVVHDADRRLMALEEPLHSIASTYAPLVLSSHTSAVGGHSGRNPGVEQTAARIARRLAYASAHTDRETHARNERVRNAPCTSHLRTLSRVRSRGRAVRASAQHSGGSLRPLVRAARGAIGKRQQRPHSLTDA